MTKIWGVFLAVLGLSSAAQGYAQFESFEGQLNDYIKESNPFAFQPTGEELEEMALSLENLVLDMEDLSKPLNDESFNEINQLLRILKQNGFEDEELILMADNVYCGICGHEN